MPPCSHQFHGKRIVHCAFMINAMHLPLHPCVQWDIFCMQTTREMTTGLYMFRGGKLGRGRCNHSPFEAIPSPHTLPSQIAAEAKQISHSKENTEALCRRKQRERNQLLCLNTVVPLKRGIGPPPIKPKAKGRFNKPVIIKPHFAAAATPKRGTIAPRIPQAPSKKPRRTPLSQVQPSVSYSDSSYHSSDEETMTTRSTGKFHVS